VQDVYSTLERQQVKSSRWTEPQCAKHDEPETFFRKLTSYMTV